MEITREKIIAYCKKKIANQDKRYLKRLIWEISEIDAKDKWNYFINLVLYKKKFEKNKNNLLMPYVLGIVPDFNIEKPPECAYGEFPDIDVDYIGPVRDYLKNDWAKKQFGQKYVCSIGNYTTFGIKSALIDMARVHGVPRDKILSLTKDLETKDEEGKPLTWDSAMRIYPALKEFCDQNQDVAKAAKKLLNRNRGMGVHAGGLIISSIPLTDMVPLVKRKDSPQASAWVEGLNGQDLQPVGLVKFDLLVISNLQQISQCCELIKNRHNLNSICALEGQSDWSDVDKWRNDAKSLEMANEGDLKCIFQFDSEGIRKLAKDGGVTSFEDLVAYSSIYRPGPLNMKMHERYIERKQGREKYQLHPILEKILGKTYGVMVYQEQVMQILNQVGNIPLKDCEAVRKAISKKKFETFAKYKDMFINNGQVNLNCSEKETDNLWSQVVSFSEYGFNRSHAVAYTYISSRLLYLKAHYPLEFYASILKCENNSDKIKEYKFEAKSHSIEMMPLDLNFSKETFSLVDNKLYFGFSNIKGIGEEPAKRIVDGQPYTGFQDFLNRFGTDAPVLKALIGLRCFRESDPVTLWKYLEFYKEFKKKVVTKDIRVQSNLEKFDNVFFELTEGKEKLTLNLISGEDPFSDSYWTKYDIDFDVEIVKEFECEPEDAEYSKVVVRPIKVEETGLLIEEERLKHYRKTKIKRKMNRLRELKKLWNKRKQVLEKNKSIFNIPDFDSFKHDKYEIDKKLQKEFEDLFVCEKKYYGFVWTSKLSDCPEATGKTFSLRKENKTGNGYVEFEIISAKKYKTSKGADYLQIKGQDADGVEERINVWSEDLSRWQQELKEGNLIRMKVSLPNNGFNTFSIESNRSKNYMKRNLLWATKEEDPRVVVLKEKN